MAIHQPQKRAPAKTEIPDKLYFRIGEVSRLCAVETYVLRFWETEFSQLRPNKSGTGQRLYRKRDVEQALRIKRLLHEEGYTIAGARQLLQSESRRKVGQPELPLVPAPLTSKLQDQHASSGLSFGRIEKLRGELRELLGMLSGPPATRHPLRNLRHFEAPTASLFEE